MSRPRKGHSRLDSTSPIYRVFLPLHAVLKSINDLRTSSNSCSVTACHHVMYVCHLENKAIYDPNNFYLIHLDRKDNRAIRRDIELFIQDWDNVRYYCCVHNALCAIIKYDTECRCAY